MKILVDDYYLSDYRCKGCNRPAQKITTGKNRSYIGVIHKSRCWFYNQLILRFPNLLVNIQREREAA